MTNRNEIVANHLQEAQQKLKELQKWLTEMNIELTKAIESRDGRAFPVLWCEEASKHTFGMANEVARANGATLVSEVVRHK